MNSILSSKHTYSLKGFTIVELLIVIVVIAILAAISIVAYNGIQQRANNTAIINAASQTLKAIQAYYAQEGVYPVTGAYVCVTTETGCIETSGSVRVADTTFDTNMANVAKLPRNVPKSGTAGYGVIYNHSVSRQYSGQARPAILMYFLNGQSQNCGMTDVMNNWGTTSPSYAERSTTGYTSNNASTDKTICYVSIP